VLDLDSKINRQNMLTHFIRRAYRRPITSTEVTPYLQFLESHYSTSRDWQTSLLQTMAAIMASPEFLYIREETGELSPHELANRLSYFLWSTMPDEELFQLASTGQLMERETYIAQLKRLLASPRSRAFKESFATQWLSLDQLGTMRPDTKDRQYGIYYSQNLEDAMRQETQLFFNHILEENLSINDFLDADYTFLNQGLANLYQIPHEGDSTLTRVALPSDSVRGGLISQASIHAITSNGVETLPVTRGHWVLHELLGAAPPPPPAEVPALVPDLNGITTVRQQLVKHREDPACMSCHKTLDPPGLVLESFDIIGRHRTHYANGQEIDPSGSFLGTSFNDITGFKRILLQHNDDFAHHLVSQLAEYAKGRTLNRADQQLVDAIIKENQPTQYRFQSLLADLLMSDLIRNR